jgi:hypothetical protein
MNSIPHSNTTKNQSHSINNKFSTVNRDISPGKNSIGGIVASGPTANGSVIA